MAACATIHVAWPSHPCSLIAGNELAGSCKRRTQPVSNLLQAIGQVEEIAVETKNRYWMLDCILAITAIALGTTAVCSFAGLAVPSSSGATLAVEVLICGAAIGVGLLFAGFVWRDHNEAMRATDFRAHQELHARFMKRVAPRPAVISVAAPAPIAPAKTVETPETMLVTSLTNVKAERRVQRRQQARRPAQAVVATAA